MQRTYTARVESRPPALVVELPRELVDSFGSGKRPALKVTVNGFQTRTRVAVYGGRSYVGFTKAVREQMRIQAGDEVELLLESDEEPRAVEMPDDLQAVLSEDADARAAFDQLSYTNRKEYAAWITSAKRAETRQRRLEQVPEQLKSGRKSPL